MYIQTQRLELKPIEDKDLDDLILLLTDDVVKQTYMLPDFPDRAAAMTLAKRIQALTNDQTRYVWGIYTGGQLIGMLNDTEVSGKAIEMGYATLPKYHNQGYTTEAMKAVIEYLFVCGFEKVIAGAFQHNIPSIRVMIKSGMQKQENVDIIDYRGHSYTCVYYAICKE